MVRINLLEPQVLSDQHLIAEYDEILMLISYIHKFSDMDGTEPKRYCLGIGHMKFFRDKILYLKKRHENLKAEMRRRGFAARKSIDLKLFSSKNKNDYYPDEKDFAVIKKRILERIHDKPGYYRYYGEHKKYNFFKNLM